MELKVKIRAMRRMANIVHEDTTNAYLDLEMFGAPSECGRVVYLTSKRRIENALKQLDLNAEEYDTELNKYSLEEYKMYKGEPTQAFYDSLLCI